MVTATQKPTSLSDDDVTVVKNAADIEAATSLDKETAEKVLDISEMRTKSKTDSEYDAIVVLEDWAHEDWSDHDVADEKVMLAKYADDYSDKAVLVEGAVEVQMGEIEDRPREEVKDDYLTNLVSSVDETDEDFHDETGESYLPKSGIEAVLVVAE